MRVLLIEDYAPLQKAVVRGLQEAGYAVDAAADGESGAWLTQSNEYDVIVLDLMLPKLDGWSILEQLRQRGCPSQVLVLTAKELLARVAALVRRKYNCKSPLLRVADLEIDRNSRTVRRSGEKLELSARELSLLEYLAVRADRVVTRNEIWEHVYGFASIPGSNVIDVYIGTLRKKVERPGWPRILHTRRGQGYVLGESA